MRRDLTFLNALYLANALGIACAVATFVVMADGDFATYVWTIVLSPFPITGLLGTISAGVFSGRWLVRRARLPRMAVYPVWVPLLTGHAFCFVFTAPYALFTDDGFSRYSEAYSLAWSELMTRGIDGTQDYFAQLLAVGLSAGLGAGLVMSVARVKEDLLPESASPRKA